MNKQICNRRAFAKTGIVKYGREYCIPVTVIKGRTEEGSGAERKGKGPWGIVMTLEKYDENGQ